MSVLAIITARGGSKRIPKKNIKEFLGKPIIAYSIEAARKSSVFDEVMVSTDSEEIAEVARKYGAAVPFYRSEQTANDFATTADVLLEVVSKYREMGRDYDWICCLYPTAPFVTDEVLRTAWDKAEKGGVDAVVPVVRFSFPPQRCFVIRDEKACHRQNTDVENADARCALTGTVAATDMLEYKWPEYRTARSQDLEPYYHDAGQFYFVRTSALLEQRTVIPERTAPLILDETRVQDIDNEEDWIIAEMKYQRMLEIPTC